MAQRKAQYPVLDVIINRRSSRAMSGESILHQELMSLFEAARWAPSSFNNQPWRFIYVTREDDCWEQFLSLINASNRLWCKNAGVAMVLISRKNFEFNEKHSHTHSFDAGAAWENLAIQGTAMGLIVHAI